MVAPSSKIFHSLALFYLRHNPEPFLELPSSPVPYRFYHFLSGILPAERLTPGLPLCAGLPHHSATFLSCETSLITTGLILTKSQE